MRRGQISSCGFFVGPTARWNEPRTYIVLGAPRGGTSMCAGAMRIAGIPMGENIASRSNEDRDFILHKGDVASLTTDGAKAAYIDQIRELVSARNKSHEVWGWKDPISSLYLDALLGDLRNPHIVFVMRDSAAVTLREWASLPRANLAAASQHFYFDQIERSQQLYARALGIIRTSGLPGLILSYERCLRYPQDFANRILAFSGMGREAAQDNNALATKIADYVTPDAVTGRIPTALPDPDAKRTVRNDLSFFGSLDDAYRACAELVNAGMYAEALILSSSILVAGIGGPGIAPQFIVTPQRFAVLEAGLCFIRAVAFANSADPERALKEVLRFGSTRDYLTKRGVVDPLVENLLGPVAGLQVSLEKVLIGAGVSG
jgi:hypothetical protein